MRKLDYRSGAMRSRSILAEPPAPGPVSPLAALRALAPPLALLLAAACTPPPPPPPGSPAAERAIGDRTLLIGQHIRAALACGIAAPAGLQDRAAAVEAAALAQVQRQGGDAARDAWLQAIAPPALPPRRQERWCEDHRPDIHRVLAWLDGPEGAAFAVAATAPRP